MGKNRKTSNNWFCFFFGKWHFEDAGVQNYFIFQPVFKYFKTLANGDRITMWKSEGCPEKKVLNLLLN